MDMFGNDDQGENAPSLSSCNLIFHAPNVSTVLTVIELDVLCWCIVQTMSNCNIFIYIAKIYLCLFLISGFDN